MIKAKTLKNSARYQIHKILLHITGPQDLHNCKFINESLLKVSLKKNKPKPPLRQIWGEKTNL